MNIPGLLASAALLFPLAIAGDSSDGLMLSPDGVHLMDFDNHSSIWGRSFQFQFPPGISAEDIRENCRDSSRNIPLLECFEPYITHIEWSFPNQEGSTFKDLTIYQSSSAFDDVGELLDSLEGSLRSDLEGLVQIGEDGGDSNGGNNGGNGGDDPPPPTEFRILLKTFTFEFNDNIDCCSNRNGEGYVIFWAYGPSGWDSTPKLYCQDQGQSSGFCGVSALADIKIINPCQSGSAEVEFWDDDGSSDDADLTDISTTYGDAVVNLYITDEYQIQSGCAGEAGKWWSERGITDSPSQYRCHAIDRARSCSLTGEHESGTAGHDNDDATLDLAIYSM